MAFTAQAGGIYPEEGFIFPGGGHVEGVAGGAGEVTHDGASFSEEGIEEAGLTDVRPADDGEARGISRGRTRAIFLPGRLWLSAKLLYLAHLPQRRRMSVPHPSEAPLCPPFLFAGRLLY